MWNSTMMKPCIAHLSQVMLFFSSFLIPSLLFLLLRAVLMNHSFDICQVKKKKKRGNNNNNKKEKWYRFRLISKLQAIAFQVKSKTNAKEKEKNLLKAVTVNTF